MSVTWLWACCRVLCLTMARGGGTLFCSCVHFISPWRHPLLSPSVTQGWALLWPDAADEAGGILGPGTSLCRAVASWVNTQCLLSLNYHHSFFLLLPTFSVLGEASGVREMDLWVRVLDAWTGLSLDPSIYIKSWVWLCYHSTVGSRDRDTSGVSWLLEWGQDQWKTMS